MKRFGISAILVVLSGNVLAETLVPTSTIGIASAQYVEEVARVLESDYSAKISAMDSVQQGSGAVVTAVSQVEGVVTATMGHIKVPVGDANGTGGTAAIWIE